MMTWKKEAAQTTREKECSRGLEAQAENDNELAMIRQSSRRSGGSGREEGEELRSTNRLLTKIYCKLYRTSVSVLSKLICELERDIECVLRWLGHPQGICSRKLELAVIRTSRGHRDWLHRILRALDRC